MLLLLLLLHFVVVAAAVVDRCCIKLERQSGAQMSPSKYIIRIHSEVVEKPMYMVV